MSIASEIAERGEAPAVDDDESDEHSDDYELAGAEVAPSRALSQAALEDIARRFDRKTPVDDPAAIAAAMNDRPLRLEAGATDLAILCDMARELVAADVRSAKALAAFMRAARRRHRRSPGQAELLYAYRLLVERGELAADERFTRLLRSTAVRSRSGVMVVAVFTSAYPKSGAHVDKFSCPYDCHYCPNEPGQPRSYLLREPGVARANRNYFNPVAQFWDRCLGYFTTGHPVDKIELLVLGGTWSSYPAEYQEEFIRDIFYAANEFHNVLVRNNAPREKRSVEEEQRINETGECRVIGVTIETRPDQIWSKELRRLRWLGVTRVQLGVQHTDDEILTKINRGCTTADAIKSFKMLKDCCFKIDMHLMPDLPGSSPAKDIAMFDHVLDSPDLQADQWKIYPCETTPWTKIKEWYEAGEYKPYGNSVRSRVVERRADDGSVERVRERYNPLFEVILHVKRRVHPWIRLNRVIRDIPTEYIEAGNMVTNLRQLLGNELKKRGEHCRCIRCRECRGQRPDIASCQLKVREYDASGGREYFVSYEDQSELVLYGFLRLRLSPDAGADGVFPELENTALIRELHVYGQVVAVGGDDDAGDDVAQHVGFGSGLLRKAEQIARQHGYRRIAVISGVGTKEYYRKRGYLDDRSFLIKTLDDADDADDDDDDADDADAANTSAGASLMRHRAAKTASKLDAAAAALANNDGWQRALTAAAILVPALLLAAYIRARK